MKIARRTFVAATGAFAAWPAFAAFWPAARGVPVTSPPPVDEPSGLAYRIDGWSVREDGAAEEAWLGVNRSFRGAWR